MTDSDHGLPFSRRDFVRLSAATAGALALPGNATASVESSKMTAEYQYVTNHTPADHAVPTLVEFSSAAGPAAMAEQFDGVVTTTEPRPAAYAKLTTPEAVSVAELPTAETLSHSPGSNPFWRLGYYPLGVFPEARKSTGFIDFEQMIDGLEHLRDHPDPEISSRLNFYSMADLPLDGEDRSPMAREGLDTTGQSPGHENNISGNDDRKDMWVAEVTNDASDSDSFHEKEQVFFSLSLHGLERAGAEAGARIIEDIVRGEDDVITNELLDEAVLVFCFTNPDGWVAKHPQYDSSWQFPESFYGDQVDEIPAGLFYERGNAAIFDTNRQYPTVGYITPAHNPGEPNGAPAEYRQKVPDALSIVEHFRRYENLNYGADLHGGPVFNEFVLGLISQDQFATEPLHELYEMNVRIDETLEEALNEWATAGDIKTTLLGEQELGVLFGVLPEEAYDYATIYDTIGYTVSGAMLDWMSHPTDLGGLGMTTMDFEMSFSHLVGSNYYNPELIRMEVTGYRTAIRTISEFAVNNSDTPGTPDRFSTETETDGESVAYVTTGSVGDPEEDALCRDSTQLSFAAELGQVDSFTRTGTVGPGVDGARMRVEETFDTGNLNGDPTQVAAELTWTPGGQDLELYLEDPSGNQVAAAETGGQPETVSASLDTEGTWTFAIETWANVAAQYELSASFLQPGAGSSTETDEQVVSETLTAAGTGSASHTVPEGLHSMSVHVHGHEALADLALVSPDGETVYEFDAVTEDRVGGKCCGFPEWHVPEPAAGEWTVEMTNRREQPDRLDVQFATLAAASGTSPDPKDAVGYAQREYNVSPFRFFEDYADSVQDGGSVEAVTHEAVANGALAAYDHAVVIHDVTPEDADDYFDALNEFVNAGKNLVLTDTGVRLLADERFDNDLLGSVGQEGVERRQYNVARYSDKNLDHPLLTDARPIQNQLWKVAPLGYAVNGEAPMYLVGSDAFRGAAKGSASVAATTDGRVATGSVTPDDATGTGVHVVSSLLPPASQQNLHPFGLLDYTVSFLGYLVLTSALGFEQVRRVGSEEGDTTVRRYGRGEEWSLSSGDGSGSSGGSGSVATAHQFTE